MTPKFNIALIVYQISSISPAVMRGIRSFFASETPCAFHISSTPTPDTVRMIKRQYDGVITWNDKTSWHRRLKRMGLPSVGVFSPADSPIPQVGIDDMAVGRMVADYFLERGYRCMGCSDLGRKIYHGRMLGFKQRVEEAGCTLFENHFVPDHNADQRLRATRRWLESLPKPVAVFGVNDSLAMQALEMCRSLDIAVPEQVAVVGVGDDAGQCNLCWPPLSSVAIPFETIGYQAASMLWDLLEGKQRSLLELVPPLGVTTRQSSEARQVDDPVVDKALQFIAAHACDPISVQDVSEHVGYSYRRLHERFKRASISNPHDEIRLVQLSRAKRLLAESNQPIHEIAAMVGWHDRKQIYRIFSQRLGMTPAEYRACHQPNMR